jgi:hypothetical protein
VSVTNKEVLAYAGFQEVPSAEDLSRCFFLDDQDLSQIARKRGDPNRLGFALQLGTLRYVGLILSDPTDVPPAVIDYVAAEVDAKDPSCVKQYLERRSTRFEHADQIMGTLGYADFATVEQELTSWIDDRAWTSGDGPTALATGAVSWLRDRKVVLPAASTLTRLIGNTRDTAQQRLWETLVQQVPPGRASALDSLLRVPHGSRVSELDRLRLGPTQESGKGMLTALDRITELRALDVTAADVSLVPNRQVIELARWGMTLLGSDPQRWGRSRLSTLLGVLRCAWLARRTAFWRRVCALLTPLCGPGNESTRVS